MNEKILSSGQGFVTTKTKRSVSETKKYVAAEQSWKGHHYQRQLPAWFEVVHVVKL